jgi:hypothetical protein
VKIVFALLLCASAHAASIPDLELLRGIAADQGVVLADIPAAPKVKAVPVEKTFEGIISVVKKSPAWRRPHEALKDRAVVPDGEKKTAWIKATSLGRSLTVGSQAWIKGNFSDPAQDKFQLNSRMLDVIDATVFPKNLGVKSDSNDLSAEMATVSPWCDHMPMIGSNERRQYLVIETKLTNKSDKPLIITLKKTFLSFDPKSPGAPVEGLTLRAANGRPSGLAAQTLDAGSTIKLQFRGDGLYPEGRHGQKLYATLELEAGGQTLFIRGSGEVLATQ